MRVPPKPQTREGDKQADKMDTPYLVNQIDEEGRDEATELKRRSRGQKHDLDL